MALAIGGYYVNFAQTVAAVQRLDIDRSDVADAFIEYPINNWFVKKDMLYVKAAAIRHPQSTGAETSLDGVLFMTHFDDDKQPPLEETDEDRRVWRWLVNEGGIPTEEIEWLSFWDEMDLTMNGRQPKRIDGTQGYRIVTENDADRWMANSGGLTLSEWVQAEDKKQWEASGENITLNRWLNEKFVREWAEMEQGKLEERKKKAAEKTEGGGGQ